MWYFLSSSDVWRIPLYIHKYIDTYRLSKYNCVKDTWIMLNHWQRIKFKFKVVCIPQFNILFPLLINTIFLNRFLLCDLFSYKFFRKTLFQISSRYSFQTDSSTVEVTFRKTIANQYLMLVGISEMHTGCSNYWCIFEISRWIKHRALKTDTWDSERSNI